jgi:hypothetical protein
MEKPIWNSCILYQKLKKDENVYDSEWIFY